jgi:RNAse (barnase) inhibitor barstar
MNNLITALQEHLEPGLYQSTAIDRDALATFCEEKDFQFFEIHGATITTKLNFFKACATAMQFPDYFGHNWDALEDCMTDLDWLPASGYVLLYHQPETFAKVADPSDWSTLLSILRSVVKNWEELRTPMYVLFETSVSLFPEFKQL